MMSSNNTQTDEFNPENSSALVVQAFKDFEEKSKSLSKKALIRVFLTTLEYPFDAQSKALMSNEELEVANLSIGIINEGFKMALNSLTEEYEAQEKENENEQ